MSPNTPLSNLTVEEYKLKVPSLDDIVEVLKNGLKENFEFVEVKITECPDLRQPPFELPFQGLSGCESVFQFGDPSYIMPVILEDKIYDFREITRVLKQKYACFFGAGGGPWHAGNFSEMIAKGVVYEDGINNVAKCNPVEKMEDVRLFCVSKDTYTFSGEGSFYCCQGNSSQVVQVTCKNRIGNQASFSEALVCALQAISDQPMAFGALFTQLSGKAVHHVAPIEMPAGPIIGAEAVKKWLTWPVLSSPFVSFGTLITKNPYDWKLLLEHFHSYNSVNQAGHYHHDTTPDRVEYLAYLTPAERLYAIDRLKDASNL